MIRSFVIAFCRNWFGLMSGAFTVPFAAAGVFADSSASKAIWMLMALAMTLLSAYFVWMGEHKEFIRVSDKLEVLQSELNHLRNDSSAKIECFVGGLTIGAFQHSGVEYVSVAVNLSLKNTGSASALEKWGFQFTVDGITYDGHLIQPATLKLGFGENTVELTASDLIERKAITPIPKGGIMRGWLVAVLPAPLHLEEAQKSTNMMNVFYSDVFGNNHFLSNLKVGDTMNGFYSLPDSQSTIKMYKSDK